MRRLLFILLCGVVCGALGGCKDAGETAPAINATAETGAVTSNEERPVSASLQAAIDAIEVAEPSEVDPVAMAAAIIPGFARAGETAAVVLKLRMHPGWRIYRYVPPGEPYVATEWLLQLPDHGLEKIRLCIPSTARSRRSAGCC